MVTEMSGSLYMFMKKIGEKGNSNEKIPITTKIFLIFFVDFRYLVFFILIIIRLLDLSISGTKCDSMIFFISDFPARLPNAGATKHLDITIAKPI